ncbi:hypothetical protein L9F63_011778 [Diploptera punctata]|uniref:Serpin domain-containing protein n=1 Tax=Diploptera punctata TaxID=6984 RepID=A0AAD8EPL9_DIPPU|nr:hypothetical protein L9F63_011778 [Diploptera punctata]
MKTVVAFLLLFSQVFALNDEVLKHVKKFNGFNLGHLHNVTSANNKFSASLYKTIAEANGDENVIISPVSIDVGLALMYLGAGGRTAQQMAAGLHIPQDHISVRLGFRHLIHSLRSSNDMDLEIANKIFLQTSLNIQKGFRRAARKAFGSDARELNFQKNSEKASKIINQWVEKRTRQKISEIIEPGVITPDTKMILANAVYLKANWLTPFNSDDTKNEVFHSKTGNETIVPMMKIKTILGFKHSEELGAKVLELPYQNEVASMFVLLPDARDGISDLESKLSTVDLATLFTSLPPEEVFVKIPKFKAESAIKLKPHLQELGFKDMFDATVANFSGITGQPDLYITHVLHKAFINVTELGTEAGASTAIVIEARMWRPPPPEFIADHPFMFVIWHKKINTALFMGRLMKP